MRTTPYDDASQPPAPSLRKRREPTDYSVLNDPGFDDDDRLSTSDDDVPRPARRRVGAAATSAACRAPLNNGRPWEPEEDDALLQAIKQVGFKWSEVMDLVGSGRTQAMCRNRYQRMMAPSKGKAQTNRCTACGLPKRGHTCKARIDISAPERLKELPESSAPTGPSAPRAVTGSRAVSGPRAVRGLVDTLAPRRIQRPLCLDRSGLGDDWDELSQYDEYDSEYDGSMRTPAGPLRLQSRPPSVTIGSHAEAYATLAALGSLAPAAATAEAAEAGKATEATEATEVADAAEGRGEVGTTKTEWAPRSPIAPAANGSAELSMPPPSLPPPSLPPPGLMPSHSFLAESLFPGAALRSEMPLRELRPELVGGTELPSLKIGALLGSLPARSLSAELDFQPSSLLISDLLGLAERPSSPPPAVDASLPALTRLASFSEVGGPLISFG